MDMPFIKILTNLEVGDSLKAEIYKDLGKSISILPGKSEAWLMIQVESGKSLCFKGNTSSCLMAEVKLYGKASKESYDRLTTAITDMAAKKLSLPSDRVYVEFEETPFWGFEGNLF